MKKLIACNWKTYINSEKDAEPLFAMANNTARGTFDLVLCPPFPYLEDAVKNAKQFVVGAQNISFAKEGAHTGEVTASMLKDLGVTYAIIGHSERRAEGETDELINKKLGVALEVGLFPILCVGEHLEIRKKGLDAAKNFIQGQLEKDLQNIYKLEALPRRQAGISYKLIVAYEPIWAIGTGVPDKPEDTIVIVDFIKEFLKANSYKLEARVLYGGSVNSKNILDFLAYKEIDGALIGKASAQKEEFQKILEAMKNL